LIANRSARPPRSLPIASTTAASVPTLIEIAASRTLNQSPAASVSHDAKIGEKSSW